MRDRFVCAESEGSEVFGFVVCPVPLRVSRERGYVGWAVFVQEE
jgi:hypothetical protein